MKPHPLFVKRRIFAPGPTPVPQEVLSALATPPLHHRTKEFDAILGRVWDNLKFLFGTKQPVYLLSSSGTGAMETAVVNLFAAKDRVLVIDGGKFGERWGKISKAYGLEVETLTVEWGESATPEAVTSILKQHKDIRGVLFQASETSAGTHHPVKEIAAAVRENSDALVVVDGITAVGVTPLPMDDWGLDVLVSGSQKALMLPPGLAFLALSERAKQQQSRVNLPKFYFNLTAEDKAMAKGTTAWTPAVGLITGLDVVLQQLRETGLESIYEFHHRLAEATRRGVIGMGLELFATGIPSTALTAVKVPEGVAGGKIVSYLRDRFGVTIAGGQEPYKGKIFRLAHLGHYDELDVLTILSAVEITLKHLGREVQLGSGVAAASQYLMENHS